MNFILILVILSLLSVGAIISFFLEDNFYWIDLIPLTAILLYALCLFFLHHLSNKKRKEVFDSTRLTSAPSRFKKGIYENTLPDGVNREKMENYLLERFAR